MADSALDRLPCAIVAVAHDRIVDANSLFATWVGVPVARLLGEPLARYLLDAATAGAASGLPVVVASDGSRRPVLIARGETPEGSSLALVDATQHNLADERLLGSRALEERTRTRLELVIDASIAFAAAETESQLAEILADTVARAYGAEEAIVVLADDDGGWELAAGADPFDGILDTSPLIARAAGFDRVVKITDEAQAAEVTPALASAMRVRGVQALIVAPLRHDDASLGLFACFFHHPRTFDAEAAPLADALAGQAAQVATTLRLQRRLQHAATHDPTTGLPNRRYLEEHSAHLGATASSRVAALFIDLDGFKGVNDELGHHTGDQLLREIGRRLQSALRDDDVVARYGGDEFIVLCEVSDVSAARDLAERLRRNLARPFDLLPPGFPVGASIGVAIAAEGEPIAIDPLVRAADLAMYRAKAAGGHRIAIDSASEAGRSAASARAPEPPDLAADLRGAVARGEISAWFQPQLDTTTGEIVAAEALCRWRHPELGSIGPATFIPVAEDAGLIGEIGRFMAEQCFAALEDWSSSDRPLDISVNVSPVQLRTSEFIDWLAAEVAARVFAGGQLTIEITESRPIADVDVVVRRLEVLRDLGVGVAIDDFGAGHASLAQLERLHGTEVKLDRSLVSDLSDRATAEMANAISVAQRSGIRVVAEGVETAEHLDRVARLGCDRAQGYLISRPMPAHEFAAALTGAGSWRDTVPG